jgi:hypothetical protein
MAGKQVPGLNGPHCRGKNLKRIVTHNLQRFLTDSQELSRAVCSSQINCKYLLSREFIKSSWQVPILYYL